MTDYKIVSMYIFEPHKAFLKENKKDKAEVNIIKCCNSNNCGLFKRGECCMSGTCFSFVKCPYGETGKFTGYSKRAMRYGSWIKDQKEKFKGIECLNSHSNVMAIIGEYIFLPYAHMTMCENVLFIKHARVFSSGNCFLKKECFNFDAVTKLINFRPQAMTGEEIESYQKKEVPKFLKHLSENMPDLFNEVIKNSSHAEMIYKEFTNIGRKAILETLSPNIGKLIDIYGGEWIWDGEKLTSFNSHASFVLVDKFKEISIIPEGKQIVKITDEGQVNGNTIFVD